MIRRRATAHAPASAPGDAWDVDAPLAVFAAAGRRPWVVRANDAWVASFGRDLERLCAAARERLVEAARAAGEGGRAVQVEVEVCAGRPWLVRLAPRPRASGDEVTAVAVDVHELRETVDALWAAHDAPARVRRALLSRASHELRTPLATVLGTIDMIVDPVLPEVVRHGLDQIRTASSSLLRRIDRLLEVGASETAPVVRARRPVLLREILEGVGAAGPDARVATELDPRLDVVPLRVDPLGLARALGHLLAFGEATATRRDLDLAGTLSLVSDHEAYLALELRVHGVLVEHAASLLDPFGGVDPAGSASTPELRLGLAAAAGWASSLGGRLVARSDDHLRLVLEVPVGLASPATILSLPPAARRLDRVLVVEDDRVVQRIVSAMVARCGLEVVVVEDGAAAVRAMVEQAFPIVLMDVNLPVLDGITATRRIRDACGAAPYIVATTAHATPEDRRSCLRAGMDAFLPKPVRLDDVRAVLTAATLR